MSLSIVEIITRSKQGRTQPYICRADDGETYFVKGASATRAGLAAEWLSAQLAARLGIPIAPYAIADVPEELIEVASGKLRDLGPGAAFASKRVDAVEFSIAHLKLVPRQLAQDMAVFDWWIRNGDRVLTPSGGNPNLLWRPDDHHGSLVVIDHNMAFDPDFDKSTFVESHVFGTTARTLFNDFVAQQEYRVRLSDALHGWDEDCAMLPDSWNFVDPEQTIPSNLPLLEMKRTLKSCMNDDFWNFT